MTIADQSPRKAERQFECVVAWSLMRKRQCRLGKRLVEEGNEETTWTDCRVIPYPKLSSTSSVCRQAAEMPLGVASEQISCIFGSFSLQLLCDFQLFLSSLKPL